MKSKQLKSVIIWAALHQYDFFLLFSEDVMIQSDLIPLDSADWPGCRQIFLLACLSRFVKPIEPVKELTGFYQTASHIGRDFTATATIYKEIRLGWATNRPTQLQDHVLSSRSQSQWCVPYSTYAYCRSRCIQHMVQRVGSTVISCSIWHTVWWSLASCQIGKVARSEQEVWW